MSVDGYLMEDPREADRLAGKVDADAWVSRYLTPHLDAPSRILDVGCGPATLAAAAARICPTATVTALDASEPRAEVARRTLAPHPNASFVLGEVHDLPFPDDTFDIVYCRFLLEYLPRKGQAVAELARVCRPGGTVLLQDLDGQLVNRYPPDPELDTGAEAALGLLATTGFDPFIGRKLRHLAIAAGLADTTVQVETYHLIAGNIGGDERDLWARKLSIAAAALTARGYPDAAGLSRRFLDYLAREDTLLFSQLFTVTATKPGTNGRLLRSLAR